MTTYDTLNDLDFKFSRRGGKIYLEWNYKSLGLSHIKSFKKELEKNAVILTFPYDEVNLPCSNPQILVRLLDELEHLVLELNTVKPPAASSPELIQEIRKTVSITPTQVLKVGTKKQIVLAGLKDASSEGKNISLYYEQSNDSKNFQAESKEEAEVLLEKIHEHLRKIQVLKIFKNLQINNPVASAEELWQKAEETQAHLVLHQVHSFY